MITRPALQFVPRPSAAARTRNGPAYWSETVLDFGAVRMPIVAAAADDVVVGLRFGPAALHGPWLGPARRDDGALAPAVDQLHSYAAGERHDFDVPLRLTGSEFQLAVWRCLLDIPYGATSTYGRVASKIGRPAGSRAVGAAVGSNPIGILVPCHRVIGADGSLTGFGGGLDNKVALLAREGVTVV